MEETARAAALAGVVFLAGFVQGVAGFGSALVAMPLLALFMDVREVSPLVALLSLTVNLLLLLAARGRAPWRPLLPLLAGTAVATPLGVVFLRDAGPGVVRAWLAALMVAAGVVGLYRGRLSLPGGRAAALIVGGAAGILGGAFNANGPPATVWAAGQPWTKRELHAALQAYFLASGLLVVLVHAGAGLLRPGIGAAWLRSLLPLGAGTALGWALHRRIPPGAFRAVVHAGLVVAGTALGLAGAVWPR